MADPSRRAALSTEAYLELERQSEIKHEYVNGELFAMAGTTDVHNDIVANVHAALRAHLRGGGCRAYFADVKVRVEAANAFFYPDVFVTCAPDDHADPLVKRGPSLIVEVLSETTAEYDRVGKFASYRQLDSLVDYVLIDSRARWAEVFSRTESGEWRFQPARSVDVLRLQSIGLELPMSVVYDDTSVRE